MTYKKYSVNIIWYYYDIIYSIYIIIYIWISSPVFLQRVEHENESSTSHHLSLLSTYNLYPKFFMLKIMKIMTNLKWIHLNYLKLTKLSTLQWLIKMTFFPRTSPNRAWRLQILSHLEQQVLAKSRITLGPPWTIFGSNMLDLPKRICGIFHLQNFRKLGIWMELASNKKNISIWKTHHL